MTETAPLTSEQKIWVLLCHLSIFLGVALLLPLIVFLVKKQDDPVTATYAKEALNFHISLVIYGVVLTITMIGVFLLPILALFAVIVSIIAAVKASNSEFYLYPLTLRLVK